MEAKIHVVRHAESVHNVDKDFSRLDPELTSASGILGLIISSPLRRTIQTTLLSFTNVLNKRYYDGGSGNGIEGGAELRLDPDLQERSALPYDTVSDRRALETGFPTLDFSTLHLGWPSKEGAYSPDDNAVN